jgi:hypothetical protein
MLTGDFACMNHTHREKTIQEQQTRPQTWILPETARAWNSNHQELASQAHDFTPISLQEMAEVSLQDRTDTKFAMSPRQLLETLAALKQDYWILSVNGQRFNHYRTLYFDTPNFDLFNLSVNERANCYKVRSREYTDSHLSFLEVKHKTHKDRTIKNRLATVEPVVKMTQEGENWLSGVFPYDARMLIPRVWNTFTRITLVSKRDCERVTLDVDLTFYTANKVVNLNNMAIAEVKMDKGKRASPFLAQMRAQKIHPKGFSKYCIGVALLYDQVKKNTLKPKMLWINKMTKGIWHE